MVLTEFFQIVIITREFVILAFVLVTMFDWIMMYVVESFVECLFIPYAIVPVIPPDLSPLFTLKGIEVKRTATMDKTDKLA